jgi:hypothetical protein
MFVAPVEPGNKDTNLTGVSENAGQSDLMRRWCLGTERSRQEASNQDWAHWGGFYAESANTIGIICAGHGIRPIAYKASPTTTP